MNLHIPLAAQRIKTVVWFELLQIVSGEDENAPKLEHSLAAGESNESAEAEGGAAESWTAEAPAAEAVRGGVSALLEWWGL